jgi:hypothetical protein
MNTSCKFLSRSLLTVFGFLIALIAVSPTLADELEGRWQQGSWSDSKSGHEGPLRAYFRQTDEDHYRVVFTGRFAKVVPFRFATTLNVTGRDGDQVYMAGEKRLGLFGRFRYNAVADGQHFHADYDSWRWVGEFNLNR